MKVLHIADSLGVGGTELAMAGLIERTRGEIDHAVCALREGGPVADRLRAQGISVTVLGKADRSDWRLPLKIARVCRAVAPDIVHTRNWGTVDGIVAARLARVPVVIHGEHGRHADDPDGRNPRRNRIRRVLAPFVDRIITVSQQLREWLVCDVGIRSDKVLAIPNGVDSERYESLPPRDLTRSHFGYAPHDFVIGTVGRLDPVKNQVALAEAAEQLARRGVHVKVVIVGDGPERDALEKQAARLPFRTIQLLGQRDDVPNLLGMLDVFALPSLAEGMCNTLLEAMAAGLPIVATNVGGNPEVVVDSVTGMLVRAGDPVPLAESIARYAASAQLRREHGDAGRQRVRQVFSLEAMLSRYVNLYRDTLARRGHRSEGAREVGLA